MTVLCNATLAAWTSDSVQRLPTEIQDGPFACTNPRKSWLRDLAPEESDMPTTRKTFS